MKIEGPCEVSLKIDGSKIYLDVRPIEPSKGKAVAKGKYISIMSNPLSEIRTAKNREDVIKILKKYYKKPARDSIELYANDYTQHLGLVGPEFKRARRRYRKYKTRKPREPTYGICVSTEMEEKVKKALPNKSPQIVSLTGLQRHQVLATLKRLLDKEEVLKKRDGKSVDYHLKQTEILSEPDLLVNDFTKHVNLIYGNVTFKKETVKEVSLFLNSSSQKVFKTKSLKEAFRPILAKHDQTGSFRPYLEYFVKSGQLTKVAWNRYEVVKDPTIPKKKHEV